MRCVCRLGNPKARARAELPSVLAVPELQHTASGFQRIASLVPSKLGRQSSHSETHPSQTAEV